MRRRAWACGRVIEQLVRTRNTRGREPQRVASLASVRTDVDGISWHHLEGGPSEGPPVVLVHGLGLASSYMEPTGVLLVEAGFRVLAPDLPGFGRSGAPPEPLDVPGMAQALARWLDARQLPKVDILANSLGCQVSAALALDAPERVGRLVLLNPNADPEARPLKLVAGLAQDAARERPSLLLLHLRDDLRAGFRRLYRAARSAIRDDIYLWAPAVRHPTLVLRGTGDPIFPRGAARRLARSMPNAIVHELAGAPHAATYSAPEAVVAATLPFLEGRHPAFPDVARSERLARGLRSPAP